MTGGGARGGLEESRDGRDDGCRGATVRGALRSTKARRRAALESGSMVLDVMPGWLLDTYRNGEIGYRRPNSGWTPYIHTRTTNADCKDYRNIDLRQQEVEMSIHTGEKYLELGIGVMEKE